MEVDLPESLELFQSSISFDPKMFWFSTISSLFSQLVFTPSLEASDALRILKTSDIVTEGAIPWYF